MENVEQFLARLDPFPALTVLAVVALYLDARRDRSDYQKALSDAMESYQDTLTRTTDTLISMKAETNAQLQLLTAAVNGLRRRDVE